jgi:hypothetical protein
LPILEEPLSSVRVVLRELMFRSPSPKTRALLRGYLGRENHDVKAPKTEAE